MIFLAPPFCFLKRRKKRKMAELETKLETFSDQLMGFSILTSPPFQSAQPSVKRFRSDQISKYSPHNQKCMNS